MQVVVVEVDSGANDGGNRDGRSAGLLPSNGSESFRAMGRAPSRRGLVLAQFIGPLRGDGGHHLLFEQREFALRSDPLAGSPGQALEDVS